MRGGCEVYTKNDEEDGFLWVGSVEGKVHRESDLKEWGL